MKLHHDTAIGSGLFFDATTFIDHKPQVRVGARCGTCHKVIDKGASIAHPLGQMLKWMHDRGWQTNPHKCPDCIAQERKGGKTMSNGFDHSTEPAVPFNPVLPVPELTSTEAVPQTTEARIGITGNQGAVQLSYSIRVPTSIIRKLPAGYNRAVVYECEGRFLVRFSKEGIKINEQNGFSLIKPSHVQGIVPPATRMGSVHLAAIFFADSIVTEVIPPILRPQRITTLPAEILESVRRFLPAATEHNHIAKPAEIKAREAVLVPRHVGPVSKPAEPVSKPIKQTIKLWSDADVKSLLDMIHDCQRTRADVKFRVEPDGRVLAKRIVEEDF